MNAVLNNIQIPEGFRENSKGHLVHVSAIAPIDQARDDLVMELIGLVKQESEVITKLKSKVFGDVAAFRAMSLEEYGVSVGGEKNNTTLTSYDGRYQVKVANQDHIRFDERLEAAHELIKDFLDDLLKDSPDAAKTIVEAFTTDGDGNLSVSRILGLRRLAFKDDRWVRGMQAINDSIHVIGSKQYVRFYERSGATGSYVAISLNVAAV